MPLTSKILLKRLEERLPKLEIVFSDGLYLNKPHLDLVTEGLQMAVPQSRIKYTPKEWARLTYSRILKVDSHN